MFSLLCYYQLGSSVPPIILDILISQYNGFSVQVNRFFLLFVGIIFYNLPKTFIFYIKY